MTGVNLIARVYDNTQTEDGKTHYADVQVDARDRRGPEQINLHLKSKRVVDSDGKIGYKNGAPYSAGQMAEMIKAAGLNKEPLLDKDGNKVGTLYGFKGNVMPASRGTGLVVNTKSVEASEFKVDDKTLGNQFNSMRAAKASQAQPPAAGQTTRAEQPAAVEEPAVG
jgi:hypothetical protein